MIPSPIVKVLSTIQKHGVKALLMGGQACVFYGAAEFSRDVDLVILTEPANLERLRAALDELGAQNIAVPEFREEFLLRGHAVHFRCTVPDAKGIRVDVMARMRGVDSFERLWERRTSLSDDDGNVYHLLSLQDLVQAKKTQLEKDWPMIARLLDANYYANRDHPTEAQTRFWLREMRTPELLVDLAREFASAAAEERNMRSLLEHALAADLTRLESALRDEQQAERERDKEYWRPLKNEIEKLRTARIASRSTRT